VPPEKTPPAKPRKPLVVKTTSPREVAIAIGVGVALLGLVIWAAVRMGQEVSGHSLLIGKILSKHFQPQPEEQMTVGPGGLDERDIDGIYTMQVRTPDGEIYTVYVEKPIYESRKVGDELSFLPPPSRAPQ
jgi:hypothetical protein